MNGEQFTHDRTVLELMTAIRAADVPTVQANAIETALWDADYPYDTGFLVAFGTVVEWSDEPPYADQIATLNTRGRDVTIVDTVTHHVQLWPATGPVHPSMQHPVVDLTEQRARQVHPGHGYVDPDTRDRRRVILTLGAVWAALWCAVAVAGVVESDDASIVDGIAVAAAGVSTLWVGVWLGRWWAQP